MTCCQERSAHGGRVKVLPNRTNCLLCELRIGALLSHRYSFRVRALPVSPLGEHIAHVVFLCTKEKVIRIAAVAHIAVMQHTEAVGNRPSAIFPRESMCEYDSHLFVPHVPENTVSSLVAGCNPQPAALLSTDILPETGGRIAPRVVVGNERSCLTAYPMPPCVAYRGDLGGLAAPTTACTAGVGRRRRTCVHLVTMARKKANGLPFDVAPSSVSRLCEGCQHPTTTTAGGLRNVGRCGKVERALGRRGRLCHVGSPFRYLPRPRLLKQCGGTSMYAPIIPFRIAHHRRKPCLLSCL